MTILNEKDFYPTPVDVVNGMLHNLDLKDKNILEPSAGKGDIIDVLNYHEVKKIIACEQNHELSKILGTKCDIISNDFLVLDKTQVSHIDYIIANPPFSNQNEHILHMWNIAPKGCKIITLANSSLLDNNNRRKQELNSIIETYGEIENLGNCFSDAERSTNVDVICIRLTKPGNKDEFDYSEYFELDEGFEEISQNGIVGYDFIQDVVSRYVGALKKCEGVMEASREINSLIHTISPYGIKFGAILEHRDSVGEVTLNNFKIKLQKDAWNVVFQKMNLDKFITSGVKAKINNLCENYQEIPFTKNNIYKMISFILETSEQTMYEVVVEAFDILTKYHDENREKIPGWKTNNAWFVGKKVILPNLVEQLYNDNNKLQESPYAYNNDLNDLFKALCFISGTNYEGIQSFHKFMYNDGCYRKPNTWYEFNFFFKMKCFKKGTIHLIWQDDKLREKFNLLAAKGKGWQLPEKMYKESKHKAKIK